MFPNRRSRIHLFVIIRSPPPPCFAFHENLETRSCSQGCTPLDAGLLICFPLLALPSTPPSSLSSSSSLFLSRAHTHTHTHWTSHQPLIVARIPNITIKFEYRWSEFKQSYGDRSRSNSQESWCTQKYYWIYYCRGQMQFFFEFEDRQGWCRGELIGPLAVFRVCIVRHTNSRSDESFDFLCRVSPFLPSFCYSFFFFTLLYRGKLANILSKQKSFLCAVDLRET